MMLDFTRIVIMATTAAVCGASGACDPAPGARPFVGTDEGPATNSDGADVRGRLTVFSASTERARRPLPDVPTAVEVGTVLPGGHPDLMPPPVVPVVEAPFRGRRRMDLAQLDAAFRSVAGGLTWVEGGRNQWEQLAPTLGRPDFLQTTEEDLTPSPLFQKFLDDAARSVCQALITREATAPMADRVFLVGVGADEPSARLGQRLDENLQRQILRFHGRDTRRGDSGALDGWRWLFLTSERLEGPRAAWMGTCVALFEHPDFFTY